MSTLLTASILLLVFAFGYYLFLRQGPAFALRRRVMLLGLTGVLLLPFCPAPPVPRMVPDHVSVTEAVKEWEVYTLNTAAPFVAVADVPSDNSTTRMMVSRVISPKGVLILGYRLILLLFLGRLLFGLFRIYRLHRGSESCGEPDVRIIGGEGEAFTFGRTVYVSESVYDSPDFAVILAHERAHAEQWHTFDALLLEVFRAVFWFHPMAWWTRRQVQLNLEYLADAAVLRAGYDRRAYQLSLVAHQHGTDFRTSILPQFAAQGLKRRIKMMSFRAGPQVRSLVAVGGLIFIGFFTFACLDGEANSVTENQEETSTSLLYNGEETEIDFYFKRLPTPKEVAVIRPYLQDYFEKNILVYQRCTDPAGEYHLHLGHQERSSSGSVSWAPDYRSEYPIRFQFKKDGKGSSGSSAFRVMPPPDGAPNEEIFLSINGKYVLVGVPGSKPYDANTLDPLPLAADLECKVGFTPDDKDGYQVNRASMTVMPDQNTLKEADELSGAIDLGTISCTYYIGDQEVKRKEFGRYNEGVSHQVYMIARTKGPDNRAVFLMRE